MISNLSTILLGWLLTSSILGPLIGRFLATGNAGGEAEDVPEWFESWMSEGEGD